MKYPHISINILAVAMSTSTLALAVDYHDDEEPFDEARLFFELNDTDGDLGIHGSNFCKTPNLRFHLFNQVIENKAVAAGKRVQEMIRVRLTAQ